MINGDDHTKDQKVAAIESEENPKYNVVKEISEWVISIIIAIALALVVHNYVGQLIKVEGPSMEPNLYTNQRMLVTKYSYYFGEVKRGDVVVTHFPEDRFNYVKRVIGLSGETIAISEGKVYIDGQELNEPYIKEPIYGDLAEYTIPDGHIFVMGDNRNDSRDSRNNSVGSIDKKLLVGKVQAVIWPFNKMHWMEHYDYTKQ